MTLTQLTSPHLELTYRRDAFDSSESTGPTVAALSRAITTMQAARILVEGGLQAVRAASGAVVLFTEERQALRVVHSVGGMADEFGRESQRLLTSTRYPLVDAARLRRELWIATVPELTSLYPELAPGSGTQAWAVLPLMIEGVVLGAVGWGFSHGRPGGGFTKSERACLRALVRAGSDAVYRGGLYDFERRARASAEIARFETAARLEAVQRECDRLVTEQGLHNTAATLTQRRQGLLADATAILDSTADTHTAMGHVANLSLPLLGDWCEIGLLNVTNRLQMLARAHMGARNDRQARAAGWRCPQAGRPLSRRLLDGKPLLVSVLGEQSMPIRGIGSPELRRLREAGLRTVLFVPLHIHGRTLGLLAVGSTDGAKQYDEVDVALAAELGRRCAASVEYSQLLATAERATQAREDFLAATAHELRTPLSHIKGFVSTLRTTDTIWDSETHDDFLAEIEREADRLARLVETLLDISRIDSGGLDRATWSATRPAALVAVGVDRIRASLGEHALDIQVADDLPPVWVDASQVERVIANLLENAAKYSPPAAPIGVVGRVVGNTVSLRVEDSGLGIPPDHVERIFEPFFREPTDGYPSKPGTGLGLAICRSIVRAQNGRIWAEQRPGGGAAFVFTLPIAGS
jgi:signal transduction histidine kinase